MVEERRTNPIEIGQRVREDDVDGVVLDCACQYAHPKAPPVYSYLIRWNDGQVRAVTEEAFSGERGLELLD